MVGRSVLAALALWLGLAAGATARELPVVKAERLGFSSERLARISEHMQKKYVDTGKLSGALTLVSRDGRVVFFDAVGTRGMEDDAPLTQDALFRIYSMSKPITAVAAMILYERGDFQLSDPITRWLPELKDLKVLTDAGAVALERPITMRHLLTHTAGFSYGFDPTDPIDQAYNAAQLWQSEDLDEFVLKVADLPLKFQPGTQWHYSIAVDLTGLIVERISGQPFDVFLEENIFAPLGMQDTFFAVPEDKADRFLPNHYWDAEAQRQKPFQQDWLARYQGVTLFSGGGGLVSTAADYFRFAEMLRNGGSYRGVRILSPKTVAFMTMDHLPATISATGSGERPSMAIGSSMDGFGFGLGFGVVTDVAGTQVIGSVGDYQWGGAAGTIFWIDPVEELIVIGMIQQMRSPHPYRSELKVLTHQALTELK